jgi:hypothetical protein
MVPNRQPISFAGWRGGEMCEWKAAMEYSDVIYATSK